ncbi:hypothetical protein K435DRAFT_692177, partial [Dendrothele bispora CBS 962.96]
TIEGNFLQRSLRILADSPLASVHHATRITLNTSCISFISHTTISRSVCAVLGLDDTSSTPRRKG